MTNPVPHGNDAPTRVFLDGPGAGRHPVFPDIHGHYPAYTTVTDPYHRSPWLLDARPATGEHPTDHVYIAMHTTDGTLAYYQYLKTINAGRPRYTCPRCGATSHHPKDAAERYCGNCHDWTAIHLYIALYGDPGTLPKGWPGRWLARTDLATATPLLPAHVTLTGVDRYETNRAGGYAEIFYATMKVPA